MTKLVWLDTETTGLDPFTNEVWEIGYITGDGEEHLYRVVPDLEQADPGALRFINFYDRIQDMRDLDDRHGVSRYAYNLAVPHPGVLGGALWSNPQKVADQLAADLGGAHVIGAVPWFDASLHGSFISEFMIKNGRRLSCHYHLIDVEALVIGCLCGHKIHGAAFVDNAILPPWDSDDLSRRIGVDPDAFARHTALGDARWAKAIWDKVTGTPENDR